MLDASNLQLVSDVPEMSAGDVLGAFHRDAFFFFWEQLS
jgi:hypothetical protein